MAIIGTLPNNIQNGQAVDANPVMADFNFIVNQVNANANPLGTLTAPSGTAMPFQQASAPLGWVAQTGAAFTDAVLHVTTPTSFVGLTGTNSAIQFLQNPWVTGGTAISVAQMPVHNHGTTENPHTHGTTENPHQHQQNAATYYNTVGGTINGGTGNINTSAGALTASAVTGLSINAAVTGITINNNGSGATHNHSNTFNMAMVDHIVAVKT